MYQKKIEQQAYNLEWEKVLIKEESKDPGYYTTSDGDMAAITTKNT